MDACLAYALAADEAEGIWGGALPSERRARRLAVAYQRRYHGYRAVSTQVVQSTGSSRGSGPAQRCHVGPAESDTWQRGAEVVSASNW
jgi:hypothetical protein